MHELEEMVLASMVNAELRMVGLLAAVDHIRKVEGRSRNADAAYAVKPNSSDDDISAFEPSEDIDDRGQENYNTTNVKCIAVVATNRKKHSVKHRPCQTEKERKVERARQIAKKKRKLKKKLFTVDIEEMMMTLNVYGPERDIPERNRCKNVTLLDEISIKKHFAMWNPNFFKHFKWCHSISCFVVNPEIMREKGRLPDGWVPFNVNSEEIITK